MAQEDRTPSGGTWAAGLAVLLVAIPAVQPFLADRLTLGYDNVLHLWRALEVDALLDQGILYARWQPHMAFGFGYPLLLFNPPLSPLVAALFHRLGLTWPSAVNAVFALGTLGSGLTTWLLVRTLWGEEAGWVAAAAIVTLPFHAYVNFHRASMSEALAWSFPGLVLWGLFRWQVHAERRGLMAASGGLAGMLLTHDASSYLLLPLLMVLIVALAAARRSLRLVGRGIAAVGLGLGLAAFYWLPSVLERSSVQFDRVLSYPYWASFVPLDYLLEPPRAADPIFVNPWLPKGVGLLPALMALLAPLACCTAPTREHRFWLVGLSLSTLGYLWVASPFAHSLWRWLPWLQYLHFPWRFLTPAAVGVAVMAGAGIGWLRRHIPIAPHISVTLLVVGAVGWLYPHHTSLPQPPTLAGMLAYERTTGQIGGTTFGELLPVWVRYLPEEVPLDDDLIAGREPVRLLPESLPDGARVLQADYGPVDATVVLETPVPFRARYLAFYYPGWRVWVDGESVEVAPTDPEGLLTFEVPAGRHAVTVRFTETPLRLAADALSLLIFLLLAALAIRGPRSPHSPVPASHRPCVSLSLFLTALFIVLLKIAVIDRVDNPLRHTRLHEGQLEGVEVPASVTFDGQFRLLGYDDLPETVPNDRAIPVRLYWQDVVPGGPDYRVTLALKDGRGLAWNEPDLRPPRWHRVPPPAYLWPPDGYALTAFDLRPMVGTPPGIYTVTLGVFDRATLAPYSAQDGSGQSLGLEILLGRVRLTRPRRPPEVVPAQYPADADLGPIRLVGYNLDRAEAAPGDPFLLTLFWKAEETPTEDLRIRLNLEPGTWNVELPLVADFPTSVWQAGDLWRGQHPLRLPARLESGAYQWTLQVCRGAAPECSPMGEETTLGTLEVHAPERLWGPPPLDVEVNARLGDVVTLLGANLEPTSRDLHPGDALTVTLVWRAEAEMETSYRVFLHLLGPDGSIVAQSDGEPANWTRPTTGWLPGEVVLDERVLTVPEDAPRGEYTLQAGMYTLEKGRLSTSEGMDAVVVGTVWVR